MFKKILLALLISIGFVACKSSSNIVTSKKEAIEKGTYEYGKKTITETSKKNDKRNNKNNTTNLELNNKIVSDAKNNVGVKYKLGGTTKKGMDCSGLVFSTYQKYDISLPRTSYGMSRHGKKIKLKEALPGDLIFFKTNGKSEINHVGIITEIRDDEVIFIHASTSKGVIVSSTKENYYADSFAQVNRVIN